MARTHSFSVLITGMDAVATLGLLRAVSHVPIVATPLFANGATMVGVGRCAFPIADDEHAALVLLGLLADGSEPEVLDALILEVDAVCAVVDARVPRSQAATAESLGRLTHRLHSPLVVAVDGMEDPAAARAWVRSLGVRGAGSVVPCTGTDPASVRDVVASALELLLITGGPRPAVREVA